MPNPRLTFSTSLHHPNHPRLRALSSEPCRPLPVLRRCYSRPLGHAWRYAGRVGRAHQRAGCPRFPAVRHLEQRTGRGDNHLPRAGSAWWVAWCADLTAGIAIIVVWRIVAKQTFLRTLPFIFRAASRVFDFDLPTRAGYQAATYAQPQRCCESR